MLIYKNLPCIVKTFVLSLVYLFLFFCVYDIPKIAAQICCSPIVKSPLRISTVIADHLKIPVKRRNLEKYKHKMIILGETHWPLLVNFLSITNTTLFAYSLNFRILVKKTAFTKLKFGARQNGNTIKTNLRLVIRQIFLRNEINEIHHIYH